MDSSVIAAVEQLLGTRLRSSTPVGGGCINNAHLIELADGRRLFLKWNSSPPPGFFEREAEGLDALAAAGQVRVPGRVQCGGPPPFLLMEAISTGSRGADFSEHFGSSFAKLHHETRHTRFGFDHDNYLGSTSQPNGWSDDWVTFWRDRRLGFQLELAEHSGTSSRQLQRLGERLRARLPELIAEPAEPACLLHGDLWGGNYMVDDHGAAVLIDPATYYGRREADLAMTYLFGGFDQRFYAAYQHTWPLEPGWQERIEIYQLYHYLNHLNLFGASYLGSCLGILQRYC